MYSIYISIFHNITQASTSEYCNASIFIIFPILSFDSKYNIIICRLHYIRMINLLCFNIEISKAFDLNKDRLHSFHYDNSTRDISIQYITYDVDCLNQHNYTCRYYNIL